MDDKFIHTPWSGTVRSAANRSETTQEADAATQHERRRKQRFLALRGDLRGADAALREKPAGSVDSTPRANPYSTVCYAFDASV
ncbi:hypothetical protein [Lysobacter enzymogenes]|uniref:hypothetical protein n=1 Tax=Lysobacter enzymogenes TaxID=69 RepID=UPI001A96346C|nr:hypothetical protein [Lysobacter enzymogenes]QQP95876.1 hypothetical protein JHW38_22095 [Lysobacter enzymogenes]